MNFVIEQGDCLERMAALSPAIVDVVVTSPPYNLGKAYRSYEDDLVEADYLEWTRKWTTEVHRLLRPQGSFFLNVGGSPSNPWLPHEIVRILRPLWKLQNTFHWIKSITLDGEDGALSRGHFKPINSKRYVNDTHEFIFHFTTHGNTVLDRLAVGVPYADKSNVARWGHTAGRDRRCRGNCWFIPYETINNRDVQRPHPAAFPVALPEMCLKIHGVHPESAVCDPFLGIGSTAVAAVRLGIESFFGYELDDDYVREARRRTLIAAVERNRKLEIATASGASPESR
jgi:site-specific DNA-methyltransferase (adenine-specific)